MPVTTTKLLYIQVRPVLTGKPQAHVQLHLFQDKYLVNDIKINFDLENEVHSLCYCNTIKTRYTVKICIINCIDVTVTSTYRGVLQWVCVELGIHVTATLEGILAIKGVMVYLFYIKEVVVRLIKGYTFLFNYKLSIKRAML